MNFKMDWATFEACKYAVENWHYSECMPAGKTVKIGVWEDDKFIGCVIYGLGATPNLSKKYNLKMTECAELCRIALNKHKTTVSKIVSISLKMLKKKCPGLKLVVSFADSDQGHIGSIYQAGNWIYSGSAMLDCWIINNKKMHPRSVVMKYGSQSESFIKSKIDKNAYKKWGIKYRYLMPLNENFKKQIIHLKKPYPKRAVSIESSAGSFQESGDGESPITALQNSEVSNG